MVRAARAGDRAAAMLRPQPNSSPGGEHQRILRWSRARHTWVGPGLLHTSQETCLSTPFTQTGHKGMSLPAILMLPRNATDTTHYREL